MPRPAGWEGAQTAASSGKEDDQVMMTAIAISVSWLSVAMIYIIAGSDRRERRF
jgi:hypothetical protein